MRWLTGLVLTLAALWGGYWFVGERQVDATARNWFSEQANFGRAASYDALRVDGFPNRFDLTVTEPRLSDPASGIGWQAPFVQVFSLAYKPWHVIAALPNEQQFSFPGGTATLRSSKLQASVVVKPEAALTLDRLTLVGDDVGLSVDGSAEASASKVELATRPDATRPNSYEISFRVNDFAYPVGHVLASTELPAKVQQMKLAAFAGFNAPLDRFLGRTDLALNFVDIGEASLQWGDVSLFAIGKLTPDARGFAEGQVTVTLTNWKQALAGARQLGLIDPNTITSWEKAAAYLASQSTDPNRIDLPLAFGNGRIALGLLTLGPAPRFYLQ